MDIKVKPGGEPDARPALAAPVFPGTPSEFIALLAHYHRAEIARMAGWRERIDRTTNWAITVVGAMLSVSLSTQSAHHGVLFFAMVLVLLLLVIESRRYRFFDVYRARVRRLERNYFAQLFAPRDQVEAGWVNALGEDLRAPRFLMSLGHAMRRRLRRNYCWLFLILLLAWLIKITSAKLLVGAGQDQAAFSPADWIANAAIGPLPGELVLAGVALFYGWLAYATLRPEKDEGELAYGDVHV
jgi:uncharacterized membrane protein